MFAVHDFLNIIEMLSTFDQNISLSLTHSGGCTRCWDVDCRGNIAKSSSDGGFNGPVQLGCLSNVRWTLSSYLFNLRLADSRTFVRFGKLNHLFSFSNFPIYLVSQSLQILILPQFVKLLFMQSMCAPLIWSWSMEGSPATIEIFEG